MTAPKPSPDNPLSAAMDATIARSSDAVKACGEGVDALAVIDDFAEDYRTYIPQFHAQNRKRFKRKYSELTEARTAVSALIAERDELDSECQLHREMVLRIDGALINANSLLIEADGGQREAWENTARSVEALIARNAAIEAERDALLVSMQEIQQQALIIIAANKEAAAAEAALAAENKALKADAERYWIWRELAGFSEWRGSVLVSAEIEMSFGTLEECRNNFDAALDAARTSAAPGGE